MKFEDCLDALRIGKSLYNSEYHCYVGIRKEKNKVTDAINTTLVDDCGCRFEFCADSLLSDKWNVIE